MSGSGTGSPSEDTSPLVCGTCGRVATVQERPTALLTWSRGADAGRQSWTCDRCAREHVRSIEGKLDPSWW